jgi:hypothetical protein
MARQARTGLFTPPGINACDRLNNSADLSLFILHHPFFLLLKIVRLRFSVRPETFAFCLEFNVNLVMVWFQGFFGPNESRRKLPDTNHRVKTAKKRRGPV